MPMLAGLLELLPWLKQWHNDPSAELGGERPSDQFDAFINAECSEYGWTHDDLRAWRPTAPKAQAGQAHRRGRLIMGARKGRPGTATDGRVLIARISWMQWYGLTDNVDVPQSTMSYVQRGSGPVYERFNFRALEKRLFGYFAPSSPDIACNLSRVDENAGDADHLDDVLVVFMARRPPDLGGGQVVVGWYQHARLYARYQRPQRPRKRQDWAYACECAERDAVLLPTAAREWKVPRGKGGMGMAKIRYFDPRSAWMQNILTRIDAYQGRSLLKDPDAETADAAKETSELVLATRQGFVADAATRRAIEKRAVAVAIRAYEGLGYVVREAGQPYDLHCARPTRPSEELSIEVKGTRGSANEVFLTRGEVNFYARRAPRTELFVVHSIRVARGLASGGKAQRYPKWRVRSGDLTPLTYRYRLPSRSEPHG